MAETVPLNYADQLTKMAETNHHVNVAEAQKLVTVQGLKRYNHALISQLGLTNDTGKYAYKASGLTKPSDLIKTGEDANIATDVKTALDQLYDLIGAGAGFTSVTGGKYTPAQGSTETVDEVVFTKDSAATDSENYYIYLTDADGKKTNIKLDASSFVKDGVLADAKIVWASAATGITDWTVDNKQTAIALPTGTYETKAEATTASITDAKAYMLFYIKNTTDTDPAGTGTFYYTTMHLATDELLGDLVGGNGIDITNGTVSVDLLSTSTGLQISNSKLALKLAATQNKLVQIVEDQTAANKGLKADVTSEDINLTGTYKSGSTSPAAEGAGKDQVIAHASSVLQKAGVDALTDLTFGQTKADTTTVTNVATEKELVATANFLQKEIESLGKNIAKGTDVEGQGNVTYYTTGTTPEGGATTIAAAVGVKDDDAAKVEIVATGASGDKGGVIVTKTTNKTTKEVSYDVYTVVANDNDIDALFNADPA